MIYQHHINDGDNLNTACPVQRAIIEHILEQDYALHGYGLIPIYQRQDGSYAAFTLSQIGGKASGRAAITIYFRDDSICVFNWALQSSLFTRASTGSSSRPPAGVFNWALQSSLFTRAGMDIMYSDPNLFDHLDKQLVADK